LQNLVTIVVRFILTTIKMVKKILMFGLIAGIFPAVSYAAIPVEYNANYKFQDTWTSITDSLVQMDATRKLGADIQPSVFLTLNQDFQKVFDFFPKDTSFKLVYQQCLSSSRTLSQLPNFNGANYNQLEAFFSSCFQPLQDVI